MSTEQSVTVFVEVVVTASSSEQAKNRVQKALVCLENSLRYCQGAAEVTEVDIEGSSEVAS